MKKIWILVLGAVMGTGCSDDDKGLELNLSGISEAPSFTDVRDGETYRCIQVGNQIWMAENLRYRIPMGALEGCYTWDENVMEVGDVTVDNEKFKQWTREAIEDGRLVNPPDYTGFLPPLDFIDMYLMYGIPPLVIIQYMAQYADIVSVLQGFYDQLYEEAVQQVTFDHFKEVEDENGGYSSEYGYLYSYEGALKAVPEGWSLPTDEDWKTLEKYLGMSEAEVDAFDSWRGEGIGRILKAGEEGIGFDLLYGGCNAYTPTNSMQYIRKGQNGYFWTSTLLADTDTTSLGIIRSVVVFDDGIMRTTTRLKGYMPSMYNVRCIKKEEE